MYFVFLMNHVKNKSGKCYDNGIRLEMMSLTNDLNRRNVMSW